MRFPLSRRVSAMRYEIERMFLVAHESWRADVISRRLLNVPTAIAGIYGMNIEAMPEPT